jgi:aryl-alcohol dehydrogenase-like predicted oxidoreductase
MEQPQYNMFHRDRVEHEYAHLYDEIGLGTTVWSPLASGLLTGKYNEGMPKNTRATLEGYEWLRSRFEDEKAVEQIAKVGELINIADEMGVSMAQMALAWTLVNPHVSTTITGSSKPQQIVENMEAIDIVPQFSEDVIEKIEIILGNKPDSVQDFR